MILSKFVDFDDEARKVKDFFMILDFKSSVSSPEKPIEVDLSESPTIEFDNVWFKYPGSDNYVLKGVTLKINKGERVGLVGENGEGKTSLALLMLRFYDPNSGSIRINGTDLRLIRREALHAICGVVFQDFELFHTRISESIRSSAIYKNNFEDIVAACTTAGIDGYIKELPDGYNHKIGKIYKEGVKLSGGQRQKIAIASLLYRDSKLMILDELKSALSPTAEDEIVNHYETISNGKTCLVICQRYKSLQFVDRVVVLSGGVIAENGTHSELMIKKGIYSQLYTAAQLKAV
jgi:ATP-binding cassette subfamily B protein